MKSSPLFVLAIAAISAPFFMGQTGLEGGYGKGGGGFGCSGGHDSATNTSTNTTTSNTDTTAGTDQNTQNNQNTNTENNVTTQADQCPPPPNPLTPNADDTCDDRDFYANVKGRDWSEEITSFFGRPVDNTCTAECGGTGDHTPWTLSIRLGGTPFTDGKSYSFSFMKDEWKSKIRYLMAKRDPNDADCPMDEQEPCWMDCSGKCQETKTIVKDGETLAKEGKTLLVSYINDVCKIGIKVEDLDSDDWEKKVQAAVDKANFRDILYCTEGVLLTATQVLDWVDTASSIGLIKDEKGVDYTQDQLFRCVKKKAFKGSKAPAPVAAPPPPAPAAAPAP